MRHLVDQDLYQIVGDGGCRVEDMGEKVVGDGGGRVEDMGVRVVGDTRVIKR